MIVQTRSTLSPIRAMGTANPHLKTDVNCQEVIYLLALTRVLICNLSYVKLLGMELFINNGE